MVVRSADPCVHHDGESLHKGGYLHKKRAVQYLPLRGVSNKLFGHAFVPMLGPHQFFKVQLRVFSSHLAAFTLSCYVWVSGGT